MLVQFGNNWIQKIPWTAKLDSVLGIFLIQLFPNWTACSPITYTNWITGKCYSKTTLDDHTLGFHPKTQKLGSPYKYSIINSTIGKN